MGLSAVFSTVRTIFLVIFGFEAAEGAPFSSHIVLGTGVRLLLRRAMPEDRSNSDVHENAKTHNSWHANRRRFHPRTPASRQQRISSTAF